MKCNMTDKLSEENQSMTKQVFRPPTPEEFESIVVLASDFDACKVKEASDKADRIEVESKLASLIDGPADGQRTITLPGKVKVVVKRGFTISADCDKIDDLCKEAELHPPVKSSATRSLDEDGYEWYRVNNPDFFAKLSKFVERKPKKVAVTVKS